MTALLLFDTLIYANKLIQAGIPKKQAEAIAEAQKDAFNDSLQNGLASKQDLADVKTELMHEINTVKEEVREVKTEVKLMKKEFDGKFNLLYWMMGFILALCSAILFKIYF